MTQCCMYPQVSTLHDHGNAFELMNWFYYDPNTQGIVALK
jgi:hypothetical protein